MSIESKQKKQLIIDEIRGKFEGSASAVVIDYLGTSVSEADEMRRKLREANVDYKVYKNKLVERAVDGTAFAEIKDVLKGPSAFAFSTEDAAAPARVLNSAMKQFDKMSFKAGIIEGVLYDAAGVKTIALLPSRDELIAKFLGSIQSPVGAFVRTLAAIAGKDGEAPEAETASKADEAPAVEVAPAETAEEVTTAADEAEAAPAEVAKAPEAAEAETPVAETDEAPEADGVAETSENSDN